MLKVVKIESRGMPPKIAMGALAEETRLSQPDGIEETLYCVELEHPLPLTTHVYELPPKLVLSQSIPITTWLLGETSPLLKFKISSVTVSG